MRIGVIGRTASGALGEMLGTARRVEEAGLATFWASQAFSLDALTTLTASVTAAPTVELGTAVIPIFTRHPQALAAQALTTQAACGGRLILGLGLSHRHVVENRWGYSFERPVDRMREYLDALLPLMRGESPDVRGDLIVSTGGLQTGGTTPPSVLLGALGPAMLRVAGAAADGTITAAVGPTTLADHILPEIAAAADKAGRPAPRIVACFSVAITSSTERAEELRATAVEHLRAFPSFQAMLRREGPEPDVAVIGDEEHADQFIKRVAAAGATDMALYDNAGTPDEQERTWAFLRSLGPGSHDGP